jgi:hypothetical protein
MGDIVNLSKYRKARTRSEQDRRSQELEGNSRDDSRPDEQG